MDKLNGPLSKLILESVTCFVHVYVHRNVYIHVYTCRQHVTLSKIILEIDMYMYM